MARISGVDIPREKRLVISLTYIYGIGLSTAEDICAATGIDASTRVRDLTDDEERLRDRAWRLVLPAHERSHFEAAFPRLNPVWIDTSAGGDQVLLLTREDLMEQAA